MSLRRTRRRPVLAMAVAVVVAATGVLAAACSGSDDGDDGSGPSSTQPAVSVGLRSAPPGKVLTDGRGRTLYVYLPDGTGRPRCTDSCAGAWPPVAAAADRRPAKGVTADVGSVEGEGGRRQMTVEGQPVYLFAGDVGPGDARGLGQGGVWFALDAAGRRLG